MPEGATATNTGQYLVTGTTPVLSASIGTVIDMGNGTWSWSYDTVDGPDETQVVTITADYAGDIHTTEFTLNVDNVAPAIAADANLVQVLVGTTAVNGGTYDDPGADTVTLAASFGTVTDNLDGTWSWSGDTTSLSDTQLVTITITDSDTASTEVTFDLVVSQVAVDSPLVTVDEGSTATNTGGYFDTGTALRAVGLDGHGGGPGERQVQLVVGHDRRTARFPDGDDNGGLCRVAPVRRDL